MRLNDLFPQRDFVIETRWPPSVAAIEIRKRIAVRDGGRLGDEPFFGRSLSKVEFQFSRAPSDRKNLLPIIDATVTPCDRDGARVHVRMRPHDGVLLIPALAIVMAILGPFAAVIYGGVAGLKLLGVSALLILGGRWHHAAFEREARRAEAILRGIFAAAPALPPPHDTGEPYR
jgi:hypothetical protein